MRTLLAGCIALALAAVSLPAEANVGVEYMEMQAWAEPNTPPEHNKLGVLRYWPQDSAATAAVILIPGNGGGAASFDIIGRWLAENAGVEVWALDRRSNHLEDHAGTDQALRTGDVLAAGMYYLGGGFKPLEPSQVSYLRHWGLRTHLNDVAEVVKQIQSRGIKDIFMGGHSLGAMISQAYAACEWPDGTPAYRGLRGIILFDGSIWGPSRDGDTDKRIAQVEQKVAEGQVFQAESPRAAILGELIIIAAALAPDAKSAIAPFVQDITKVTSPLTNLALFGMAIDTDFADLKFHALCRAGRLADASPDRPDAPRGWVSYDKCGEVTDAAALAKALTAGRGAAEWYQPLALLADVGKASKHMLNFPEMGLKYQSEMDLPVIAFLANAKGYDFADGLRRYVASIKGRADIHNIDPPGTYAHLDPIVAADAPTRVFAPLKAWMQAVLASK